MTADRMEREALLHEALNDVLHDWMTCLDPSERRRQLKGILLNESPWPFEDYATSLLFIREHGGEIG